MADVNGWSLGWTTNGTGDGIAGGYTQAKFIEWQGIITNFDKETYPSRGVFSTGSALYVTASGGNASPVTIDHGAAMIKGFFYRNDTAGTLNIPTPAAATRIDLVVLRADWGSQVVRFQRVAGTEGVGTPALTQTDETTWEIPLATVSITTGGVASVTDTRQFTHFETHVSSGMIDNGAVTTLKIANENVTAAKIENRTRTFWVPALHAKDAASTEVGWTTNGFTMQNAAAPQGSVLVMGRGAVPNDYVSGWSSRAFLYPSDSNAGTAYITHTVSYVPTPTGQYSSGSSWVGLVAIASGNQARSTAVALSGISAGDNFVLTGRRDSAEATDVYSASLSCPGFLVSYTADS